MNQKLINALKILANEAAPIAFAPN